MSGMKLIECVPNFSEGRDLEIIGRIREVFAESPGVRLLDVSSDGDHNRTVVSIVGDPEECTRALLKAAAYARKSMDIGSHKGVHPRIGVIDVVPFIPVSSVSMEDCVEYANRFAAKLHIEQEIPVYLYQKSARVPERERLSFIRQGGYEKLKTGWLEPDIGKRAVHPTAGACAVCARYPLVAYNIVLDRSCPDISKKIAARVRSTHVMSMGVELEKRGVSQVSMNLLDVRKVPIKPVFDTISEMIASMGVEIAESEIIGFVPREAMKGTTTQQIKLPDSPRSIFLEDRIAEVFKIDRGEINLWP